MFVTGMEIPYPLGPQQLRDNTWSVGESCEVATVRKIFGRKSLTEHTYPALLLGRYTLEASFGDEQIEGYSQWEARPDRPKRAREMMHLNAPNLRIASLVGLALQTVEPHRSTTVDVNVHIQGELVIPPSGHNFDDRSGRRLGSAVRFSHNLAQRANMVNVAYDHPNPATAWRRTIDALDEATDPRQSADQILGMAAVAQGLGHDEFADALTVIESKRPLAAARTIVGMI